MPEAIAQPSPAHEPEAWLSGSHFFYWVSSTSLVMMQHFYSLSSQSFLAHWVHQLAIGKPVEVQRIAFVSQVLRQYR